MSDYNRNANARFGAGVSRAGSAELDQGLRAYMLGVYNNMALGLAITGLVAFAVHLMAVSDVPVAGGAHIGSMYLTGLGVALYASPLKWLVMLAPLGFIFFFSFRIESMSAASARMMFFAFAATMGLSLSVVLLIFTGSSVARAFFMTSATFGALSIYGYTTKRDLTAMGTFMVMALFGLIIASVVNIFLQSSMFQFALSILSIGIFAGLTAWDTQSIKEMYFASDSHEVAAKKSIHGALHLYLDFINIFQSLLSLAGDRN